jgi:hypothetical protein
MGCPPEAKPKLLVFVDEIELQKVEPDYTEGWALDGRIAYCHSGYYRHAQKVAITQEAQETSFELHEASGRMVIRRPVEAETTAFGTYYKMDFSDVTTAGSYYLKIDDRMTPVFVIDEEPYSSSIWKSINFLRMLRCGEDVEGVHSPCHLNCYTSNADGRLLPNHGGWHDAGDVSQFEICTAEMAHAICDLAEKYLNKDQVLAGRLLQEARVGLNWLFRTRFGDGSRALAVYYSIWRKNIIRNSDVLNPRPDSALNNVAENGPFENFLASAAEAKAAVMFRDTDEVFAGWCLRSAAEDFAFAVEGYAKGYFTRRWGLTPEAQLFGAGALAAAELYRATGDEAYLAKGNDFAEIILKCQQSTYPDWEKQLRGFFWEDQNHTRLLTYEHRGHEQSPVHGLVKLCEVAPNYPCVEKWKQCLRLYGEYVLATCHAADPYGMLPAQVYDTEKIDLTRFTVPASYGTPEQVMENLKRQIRQGIRLDDNVYLRRFPIAIQRRGFHATLLSKTKAVSSIARLLGNEELRQVAINQLEWALGKNPFESSTMYGEGHNYHPLYVAFSQQMVGSLPVGIKTLDEHDAPYWPVINNAVYKEIWGHTTGKFLWVLADL